MCFEDGERSHESKKCRWPFEAESGKETDYHKERRNRRSTAFLQKAHSPANTLILNF